MKIGVSVKIDVSKIEKARLYQGTKGTYLDMTTFIDLDQKDQFENNGFISQDVSKEEREAGEKGKILGNVRVFYRDNPWAKPSQGEKPSQAGGDFGDLDESIPF